MAVVEAVATAEGVDPIELNPLNDTIDPDALDALFASTGPRGDASVGEVSLHFGGHHVTVRGTGELLVRPSGPSAGS
jgi:hypothetical protein